MLKNLAQLKKRLITGAEFEIIDHRRPELIGQRRKITVANTQGFYSMNPDDPDGTTSRCNRGRGAYLDWRKAPCWDFKDGVCTAYCSEDHTKETLIMTIKVREEAQ